MIVQPNFPTIRLSLLALGLGLLMLSVGGEVLVAGATRLAKRWGMPTLLVGLTVVAFGTSTPELFVGLMALLQDHPDIMVGNVVGSNIANIGLILGICGLLAPMCVTYRSVRFELYLVLAATALLGLIAWLGVFYRIFGLFFVSGLILYTGVLYRTAIKGKDCVSKASLSTDIGMKNSDNTPCWSMSYGMLFMLIGCGLLLLAFGSGYFIDGAVDIARHVGVSELIIGLTLAAVGTSLPELASSFAAIRHRQTDLAVGNIIGSNLFNILMVLGGCALVKPFVIATDLLSRDLPVMFAYSAALMLVLSLRSGINRIIAMGFLSAYGIYIFSLL